VPSPDNRPPGVAWERGLSGDAVAERTAKGLVNRVPRSDWAEYGDIAVRNVFTLFNALVVPAATALFLLSDYPSAWAVSAYALFNTLIGLVQEVRAKLHLDRLIVLADTKVRAIRDGAEVPIASSDIVRDDCICLGPGETIAADGVVLDARYLEVDEALLTGESDPVVRRMGDRLLSGSVCIAGEGTYCADTVGGESFAQRTTAQARRYRFAASPMQHVVNTLIRILTAITLVLCALYAGMYYVRGFAASELWQMIAATVTSMVPQGLVLMTTLAFALGAVRLSARGAVVRRLSAVESMAAVDILCMDKTGTLTTSQLRLDQVRAIDASEDAARTALRLFASSSIDSGSKTIQALRVGLGPLLNDPPPELIDQLPFKSQNRYSAVRVRVDQEQHLLVLGGFEPLRSLLDPAKAARAEALWRKLLPTGLRLLLLAEARDARDDGAIHDALHASTLTPVALVALSDELRPEAGQVLLSLADQGIRFKILSGDHPETVRAAIDRLRLGQALDRVIAGDELEAAADKARIVREGVVFGRVTPQQKLDIVTLLQADGHHVGMIGDGVNDVLPIKQANLGIAMGAGSKAAKAVAGLVLETNSFALLPATLDEGRTILDNLRRAAKLFLLKNVYSLILIVIGLGVLGLKFPYLPQQVTLLNALTIGGPALLIMFARIPNPRRARMSFLREVGLFALVAGLSVGAAGLAVWFAAANYMDDPQMPRTLLLSILILLGLGNVLIIADRDQRLVWWAAMALPAYLAVMYNGPLGYFFALSPLAGEQWALIAVIAAAALVPCGLVGRYLAVDGGS
jgi:cation-transporting P-type ATPase E